MFIFNWFQNILKSIFGKQKEKVKVITLPSQHIVTAICEVWAKVGDESNLIPCQTFMDALNLIWNGEKPVNQVVFHAGSKILVLVNHDYGNILLCGSILPDGLSEINTVLQKYGIKSFKNSVEIAGKMRSLIVAAGLNDGHQNPNDSFLFPVEL